MKMATVFDSSLPVSMIRRQSGIISVVKRKVIVGEEFVLPCVLGVLAALMPALDDGSFLTNAPMTPRDVSRKYSNGLDLDVVFKKGYRKSGICAGTY
jgi:hypothetical protein